MRKKRIIRKTANQDDQNLIFKINVKPFHSSFTVFFFTGSRVFIIFWQNETYWACCHNDKPVFAVRISCGVRIERSFFSLVLVFDSYHLVHQSYFTSEHQFLLNFWSIWIFFWWCWCCFNLFCREQTYLTKAEQKKKLNEKCKLNEWTQNAYKCHHFICIKHLWEFFLLFGCFSFIFRSGSSNSFDAFGINFFFWWKKNRAHLCISTKAYWIVHKPSEQKACIHIDYITLL